MTAKKAMLDEATAAVLRKVLAMPPKPHEQMKVGRESTAKQGSPKGRASSAKRRTASKTDRD